MMSAATCTSCLSSSSDDQKQTYTYGASDCFNLVRNLDTGDQFIASAPNYKFQYNISSGNVDITLSNVVLAQGMGALSFKLPSLKYTQDTSDGFIVSSGRSLTPENMGASTAFVFDSFTLRAYPGRSVFNIKYTLNNSGRLYSVTTYDTDNTYFGPTSATNLDPNATKPNYTNAGNDQSAMAAQAQAYYRVLLNAEKRTATLALYNAKFSDSMNPMSFMVKDIPFTFTYEGFNIVSDADAELKVYTPTSGDKPAEGLNVTDLSVVANLDRGATIRFNCDLGDTGKYSVTASLRYLIYGNSSSNN